MLRYFLIVVLLYIFGSYLVNNKHEGMYIHADGEGYYLYLPAMFVYGTFKNIPYRTPDYFPKDPFTGKVLDKYTSGTAILVSPFFLAAHFSRKIQGFHTPDPYAVDFSVAMLLAACFYGTLGMYFLYHFLMQFFSKRVVTLTIISLVFGTNVLHYIVREPLLSHIYSFCLVAILLYLTPKFFNTKHETRNYIL